MIRAYGLHWSSNKVHWGRRGAGNAGRLLGYEANRNNPVDFRNQKGIYALYDDCDLVYVGQVGTGNIGLLERLRDHFSDDLKGC